MKAQVVSFHCVLKDQFGKILSSSFNQDVINQLEQGSPAGSGQRLKGLVEAIQNVHAGERRRIAVCADDAYGPYDPRLVTRAARSELPKGDRLVIGSELVSRSGPGDGSQCTYRVIALEGETVVLDANHPLAGQDLVFEIEVVSAREAKSEDFEDPFYAAPSPYVH